MAQRPIFAIEKQDFHKFRGQRAKIAITGKLLKLDTQMKGF